MNLTKCGCRIQLIGYQGDPDEQIIHCSLHEAAPKLLAIIEGFAKNPEIKKFKLLDRSIYDILESIIKEAKGKNK